MNADGWNQAVLLDPGAHLARLEENRRASGLTAVPTFARPVIGDAADLEVIARDLALVHSAIAKLVKAWGEGRAGAHVRLSPEVAQLAKASLARGHGLGFTRYDVLYASAQRDFRVLECQAGDPSGLGWADAFAAAFEPGRPRIVDALAELIRASVPGVAEPSVAFVCARESFVRSDHALMARTSGLGAQVVDARELVRRADGLYAGRTRLDLCVRDTIDELVLEPLRDAGRVLLDAWRDGVVEVLNPFAAIPADDKTLFEALSTGAGDFTPDERAALVRRIPWTRVLTAAVLPEVLERRAQLVLKPADGYGGFGVAIGAEHDGGAWRARVEQALAGDQAFVVQEYLPLPEEDFPVFAGGGASLQRLKVVGSFWWIHGRFAGGYHRAAPQRVINVHQGGGLTPTFFL